MSVNSRARPEHQGPAEIVYGETEAAKYTTNSRMQRIQKQLAERALELLALPPDEPCFIADLGCGSGLSGDVLTEAGHHWFGFDISKSMLDVALSENVAGDLCVLDLGDGIPVRSGVFDAAISISAVQWLCQADHNGQTPRKRLMHFFNTLYASLRRGARAVIQLYPESDAQLELITSCAMRAGFSGGCVVDWPNSAKSKKYFLCLFAGSSPSAMPTGLGVADENGVAAGPGSASAQARFVRARDKRRNKQRRKNVKDIDWLLAKKERRRAQGKKTASDSKYSGRRRKGKF